MYKVIFKKPNGTVSKLTNCTNVEFYYNGTIAKVTDAVGDFLYINTRDCLIYEGDAEDGEADGET